MSGQGQSADSAPSKENLLLDGLRRLETHSPLYLLPKVILNHQLFQMLLDSRQRVKDSHKYQQHLLGEEVGNDPDAEIRLQGDTTTTNNYHGSRALPLLLGAALLAGTGLGSWYLWNH